MDLNGCIILLLNMVTARLPGWWKELLLLQLIVWLYVGINICVCLFFLFFLQDVFQCMLRNLFEEYRFFPQYPDRELQTTAVLFGGIIDQGIVT